MQTTHTENATFIVYDNTTGHPVYRTTARSEKEARARFIAHQPEPGGFAAADVSAKHLEVFALTLGGDGIPTHLVEVCAWLGGALYADVVAMKEKSPGEWCLHGDWGLLQDFVKESGIPEAEQMLLLAAQDGVMERQSTQGWLYIEGAS